MKPLRVALGGLVLVPLGLVAGCGDDGSASGSSAPEPTATVTVTQTSSGTAPTAATSPTPTETTATTPPIPKRGFPCDPGGGYPKPSDSCPYGDPLTGDVMTFDGRTLTVKPFHTYYNDAEGKAYAEKHHLDYPFDDDHYDAPAGPVRTVQAAADTVCTGIIGIGRQSPTMRDHLVPCSAFEGDRSPYGVPAALWSDGDRLVQLSELFRP